MDPGSGEHPVSMCQSPIQDELQIHHNDAAEALSPLVEKLQIVLRQEVTVANSL